MGQGAPDAASNLSQMYVTLARLEAPLACRPVATV